MKYQIIKDDGGINLGELSRYNGKSEFENTKMIVQILTMKAEVYNTPQTIRLTFKGNEVESDIEL